MIEDMNMRKLAPKTQSGYVRAVKNLTRFLGHSPDTATLKTCAVTSCTWSIPASPAFQ